MGYRSDVAIAITKEAYLTSVLKKDFPSIFKDDWVEHRETTDAFYWFIEDIKWYESYSNIAEVITWMNNIEPRTMTNETNISTNTKTYKWEQEQFAFVRIGEDDRDVETLGDPYFFDLHVNRYIAHPWNN